MLKKAARLPRALFDQVFTKGRKKHGLYTTGVTQVSPTFKGSVVVGKKVAKKAHDRNRIKRRVYAILEAVAKAESPALAMIVIIKPALAKLTKAEQVRVLKEEIEVALKNR